jgi:MFS family permease
MALLGFSAGSVLCTLAPTMTLLLVGRVAQGLAGGLLAGLGYAVISAALPDRLWTRASAVVSGMWGVGTLIGPATGGIFAQVGLWRGGFGILAVLAIAMSLLVPIALPARSPAAGNGSASLRIPVRSLLLLGLAALAVSVAALPRNAVITACLLVTGVVLVLAFIAVDRRADAAVLPRSAFGPGPLKWIYATLGLLMGATMVDMYAPLFGQRLGALAPFVAGFLGAALSVGWTGGEIASASVTNTRATVRLVAVAPLVMAVGLAIAAASQKDGASTAYVVIWVLALVIAGTGLGIAWPHLSAWAMGAASKVRAEAHSPMRAITLSRAMSFLAAVADSPGRERLSSTMSSTGRPTMPPAALRSSTARRDPRRAASPKEASRPVTDMKKPSLTGSPVGAAAWASAASARPAKRRRRRGSMVRAGAKSLAVASWRRAVFLRAGRWGFSWSFRG